MTDARAQVLDDLANGRFEYMGDAVSAARAALAATPAVVASYIDQSWRDSAWVGMSASERACYEWAEDTDMHRQCRAAYIAGATDYATQPIAADAATPAFEINPFANEPPATPAVGGEEITKAIRDYLQKKHGTAAVQVSSDGIERIYYNGVALIDLANALAAQPASPLRGRDAPYVDPDFDQAGNRRYWEQRNAHEAAAPPEQPAGIPETLKRNDRENL